MAPANAASHHRLPPYPTAMLQQQQEQEIKNSRQQRQEQEQQQEQPIITKEYSYQLPNKRNHQYHHSSPNSSSKPAASPNNNNQSFKSSFVHAREPIRRRGSFLQAVHVHPSPSQEHSSSSSTGSRRRRGGNNHSEQKHGSNTTNKNNHNHRPRRKHGVTFHSQPQQQEQQYHPQRQEQEQQYHPQQQHAEPPLPPRVVISGSAITNSHLAGRAHSQYGASDTSSQEQASSSYSEDLSNYSAQSASMPPPPSKLTIVEYPTCTTERRNPSPISFASQKRDLSTESSSSPESDKQYSRTTRRIVEELSRAQGTARRVAAVTSACEAFDHYDDARHSIELSHGSVQALARMLEQPRTTDDELRMICSALEMVFRGKPRDIQEAFKKTSGSFLSKLLSVLERCENRSVKHADISILNITKIFLYLSKCPDLRVSLCRHPDILEFLARVATQGLNPDCRALRLKVVANLAAADENKVLLHEYKPVLDGILRIAHMDSFGLARQHAAVVLQEMASSSQNHVVMANNPQLLGVLVKMALIEKSLLARDSVVSALQALAFTKKNRVCLVGFKDGVVLEALKRTLSIDPDDKIRRRAAGTLTNLACEETAEAMGSHKGLLESLAIITTKDYNSDVQNRAALALTKIGSSINYGMDCFNALMDALVVASLSNTSNSVTAVLRLKAREVQNREAMALHTGVLDTLADTCASAAADPADRENAMRALLHLVNDDQNKRTMCNKIVLHALVRGANLEEEELRDSAIRALERLATESSNRHIMARHPGLLQVVAKATEREVKLEDSKVESEHGYLAKPLLMTLLLAM